MESGEIQSYQIGTPISCYSFGEHRLFGNPMCQLASWQEGGPFRSDTLSIDLLEDHVISAIATQGVGVFHYATNYVLMYQETIDNGSKWRTYRNIDGSMKVYICFKSSITPSFMHV